MPIQQVLDKHVASVATSNSDLLLQFAIVEGQNDITAWAL